MDFVRNSDNRDRQRSFNKGDKLMKRFLAVGALLLVLGASARADNLSVTVDSSTPLNGLTSVGGNLNGGQWAGTFIVQDTSQSNATFTAFCTDLSDHVSPGNTLFSGAVYTGAMPNTLSPPLSTIWTTSYSDVGHRLDYLLTQIMAPSLGQSGGLTADMAAALQAVIWSVANNATYTGGDSAQTTYITDLLKLVGPHGSNGTTFTGTSGWTALDNANTNSDYFQTSQQLTYVSSREVLVVPSPSPPGNGPLQYQVLIGYNTSGVTITSVTPEPSTMAIAGLGALGMIGYGWKRRKRA